MKLEIIIIISLSAVIFAAAIGFLMIGIGILHAAKKEKSEKITLYTMISKDAMKNPIVFLGDSITEFYRINEIFFAHYTQNRGVSTDTTDGVLKRMHDHVVVMNPHKLFLMIGTNDLGLGKKVEYIITNIIKIIEELQQELPQTQIILWSLCPVNKKVIPGSRFIVGKRKNKDIDAINAGIKTYAEAHGLVFIDINTALKDDKGNLKQEYTLEGLHLSYPGYIVITDHLKPYIE